MRTVFQPLKLDRGYWGVSRVASGVILFSWPLSSGRVSAKQQSHPQTTDGNRLGYLKRVSTFMNVAKLELPS
jgi:hypothetical protein